MSQEGKLRHRLAELEEAHESLNEDWIHREMLLINAGWNPGGEESLEEWLERIPLLLKLEAAVTSADNPAAYVEILRTLTSATQPAKHLHHGR